MQMTPRTEVMGFAKSIRDAAKSRIAWLLACLHGMAFLVAVANMSPPSPGLGTFLDGGGGSSATLLAGRPFHFEYESLLLRSLVLLDLPATVAMIPVSFALVSVLKVCGFGFYAFSYVTAIL